MICDQDPPQRRTRKSTVRKKQWERCVRMTTKLAKWASEHGQITKIWFQKAAEVKRFE